MGRDGCIVAVCYWNTGRGVYASSEKQGLIPLRPKLCRRPKGRSKTRRRITPILETEIESGWYNGYYISPTKRGRGFDSLTGYEMNIPEAKFKLNDQVRKIDHPREVWVVCRCGWDAKMDDWQYSLKSGSRHDIAYEGDLKKA